MARATAVIEASRFLNVFVIVVPSFESLRRISCGRNENVHLDYGCSGSLDCENIRHIEESGECEFVDKPM